MRDGRLVASFNVTAFAKIGVGEFSIAWNDFGYAPNVIVVSDCVVAVEGGQLRCVDPASGAPRAPADLRFLVT